MQKKEFGEACKLNNIKKEETKNKYMKSQLELRIADENEEENITNKSLQELAKQAKINPSILWETRKRTKGCNSIEYKSITEEGRYITNP